MATTRNLLIGLAIAGIWPRPAAAVDVIAKWTGAGDGVTWSRAANWDVGIVPGNVGTVLFDVTIALVGANVAFDVAAPTTVRSLNLGGSSTMRPLAARSLLVTDAASLAGLVDASAGGSFTALGAGTAFTGNSARAYAGAGAQVNIGATAYSSKALAFAACGGGACNTTTTLFNASGSGTRLGLGSVQNIDAGFSPVGNDSNYQQILASAGAVLDLSGVQSVKAPVAAYDLLRFSTDGAGTTLKLDRLSSVTSAGSGRTFFEASNGASLNQGQLAQLQWGVYNAASGASISVGVPALAAVTNTTFSSVGGASIMLGGSAAYDAKGLASETCGGGSCNTTTTLLSAAGSGSRLNLATLKSIDSGFSPVSNDSNYHQILASAGAVLDLSGVQTIKSPVAFYDLLRVAADGSATSLRLDGLAAVSSAGSGRTSFEAAAGAQLALPSLATISTATFSASSGGVIGLGTAATYASKALITESCGGGACNTTTTLLSAAGAGSRLNFGSLKSMDAGFSPVGNDSNYQQILASAGAVLDLSGVQSVKAPVAAYDLLRFSATGVGTLIDLSRLATATSAGSGALQFSAADHSKIVVGGADFALGAASLTISGASTIVVVGSLKASGALSVTLGSSGDRLEVRDSLKLGNTVRLSGVAGSAVSAGGSVSYDHTDETRFQFGHGTLVLNGSGGQKLEVGGIDVDVYTNLLSNDNFGFGQIVVGQSSRSTFASLVDLVNNGNRGAGGAPEALYLFGLGAGTEGLRILGGSSLVLDGLPAYAYHGGTMINLYNLFPAGVTRVAFDDGFLLTAVPEPSSWLLMGFGLAWLAARRRNSAKSRRDG